MKSIKKVIILGAGLSGLSAAYHLNGRCDVYEKNSEVGGHARSLKIDGFTFDYGPHILYTINPYMSKLIHSFLKGNLYHRKREAWIYHLINDTYTRFPFQSHLYGLPQQVVKECLVGLFEAKLAKHRCPGNYLEWMEQTFGAGITKHLMVPYAKRIWTIDPDQMNYDWIARRVPTPDIETIIEGAVGEMDKRVGFNSEFWYPKRNGIEALPQSLGQRINKKKDRIIHLNHEIVKISLKHKEVLFASGEKAGYEKMICTLPLPVVIKELIKDVPSKVYDAADELKCNSIVCVNIGINREDISDKQWVYFYEKGFSFHRISFPQNFSPYTVPKGMSSVSTEVAHSKYREVNKKTIIDRVINDLQKAKILKKSDKIITAIASDIKYAYVIYDLNHRKNVGIIHSYLRKHDIFPCGRFGEWEYFNMDHSMLSGKKTAEAINHGE